MNRSDADKLYDDYLRQIEAEDRLMGLRLQWTLTFQGFLFASFGLSTLQQTTHAAAHYFANAAPVLGGITAALGFIGVLAAQRAANKKRNEWRRCVEKNSPTKRPYFLSSKLEWYASSLSTLSFPLVIMVFWILVALQR